MAIRKEIIVTELEIREYMHDLQINTMELSHETVRDILERIEMEIDETIYDLIVRTILVHTSEE